MSETRRRKILIKNLDWSRLAVILPHTGHCSWFVFKILSEFKDLLSLATKGSFYI